MKDADRITEKLEVPPLTPKKRVGIYLVYAAMVMLTVAAGTFLYWSFQKEDVLQVHNSPFPVRTIRQHPTADGVVILNVDFCKQTEAVGRLRTSFVSPSREILKPIAEERGPKGCTKTEVPVIIPHETPADTYRVKFRVEYKINPIKTAVEEFYSLEFIVDEQE